MLRNSIFLYTKKEVMKKNISIINGPNINMLGKREISIYGTKTLQDIEVECREIIKIFPQNSLTFYQSNSEQEIIEYIQQLYYKSTTDLITNLGAFSHTSIAILDALQILNKVDIYELHISNIFARENFRHHSYISSIAKAVITGLGTDAYQFLVEIICKK